MGLRDKNHPRPPTSAYPGRKGIYRSESCRATLSDKGLSQGQGQPCEREVEPEIPVPRASWDVCQGGWSPAAGTRWCCLVLLAASGSAPSPGFSSSLAPSLASGLLALPLPQPVSLCPWPYPIGMATGSS